jgi:hypothetical protein
MIARTVVRRATGRVGSRTRTRPAFGGFELAPFDHAIAFPPVLAGTDLF